MKFPLLILSTILITSCATAPEDRVFEYFDKPDFTLKYYKRDVRLCGHESELQDMIQPTVLKRTVEMSGAAGSALIKVFRMAHKNSEGNTLSRFENCMIEKGYVIQPISQKKYVQRKGIVARFQNNEIL